MPISSADLVKALKKHGFAEGSGQGKRGTHRTFVKAGKAGELHLTVTVVLNQREIPKSTLGSICRQLGVAHDDLKSWIEE
jgi:predicted RNA binding protein YcfA (HicA-like mRNA interferase family)